MATIDDPPPVTLAPESRLDSVARNLSRTLLHGARAQDTAGKISPATIATGQQIPVDLPDAGSVDFNFSADGSSIPVSVTHDQALDTRNFLTAALGPDRGKYLTLSVDPNIPTWVFHQRRFTMANPPVAEDTVAITLPDPAAPPPATISLTAVKLPTSALEEVDEAGSFVSLWSHSNQSVTAIPKTNWRPAIVVRFPLTRSTPPLNFPTGMQVFQLGGAPQGDRWFLDQLGLLPGSPVAKPPEIQEISLTLEKTDASGNPMRTPLTEWSMARANLTGEARANQSRNFATASVRSTSPLPYVALSGVGPDQDKDAIRLLEMASITNSGGYFLRATTDQADAPTLILVVVLKAEFDPNPDNEESVWLPTAANALALAAQSKPDTIQFNGLGHIEIAPFTPPGTLSFGWTRTEPQEKTTDEDKFGFGTISMVEYSAQDATGQFLCQTDAVIAISPLQGLSGDHYSRLRPSGVTETTTGVHNLHSGDSAAMRLLPPREKDPSRPRDPAAQDPPITTVRYYRSTLTCYSGNDSPWKRLSDPRKSQISFTPAFRDVFGNRFEAASAPSVLRRLFYTDPLISPAEWPGVRFALYPNAQRGQPGLSLEMSYRFLQPNEDKTGRLQRLLEICTQLDGVNADVTVTLKAEPLLKTSVSLDCPVIAAQLLAWRDLESKNKTVPTLPLVVNFASVACDGQITNLARFQPTIEVARTKPDYCPQPSDLPSNSELAQIIQTQVTSTAAPVVLQAGATLPTTLEPLSAAPPAERKDEFRDIAEKFQEFVARPMNLQVGFLRNNANQHELWLIPNAFFPSSPDPSTYATWSFATPRPLSNTLGTETFQTPNFAAACASSDPTQCWEKYPLVSQTIVDQDFDQLGRLALRSLEAETSDLAVLTLRQNADLMRSLLATREQIADELAVFDGPTTPWLVPLFATPSDIDGAAVSRIARDAFLRDLSTFYAVSTILQLPLTNPGAADILTFEGAVTPTFAAAVAAPPTFSDVLVSGGDRKITILYDLPPDVIDAKEIPPIAALSVAISHVQLPISGIRPAENPFSQGKWVELAEHYSLAWKGYPDFIPVALRTFPSKPIIQSTDSLMPWMDPVTRKVAIPGSGAINSSNIGLLPKWGWAFSFGMVNGTSDDIVHIAIRYNGAEPSAARRQAWLTSDEWRPKTLLQSLFVLKLLQDNWGSLASADRLSALGKLATYFAGLLASTPATNRPSGNSTLTPQADRFTLAFKTTAITDDQRTIMKGPIDIAPWKTTNDLSATTLTARAEANGNAAFLTGTNPMRNYKITLQLLRNERFGELSPQPADPRLIYRCAPVESPLDVWPQNLWAPPLPPLSFDMTGFTLETALVAFFDGLFNQGDLSSMRIEVGASLAWRKGRLTAVTPFSILPADSPPTPGTANGVAAFVFGKCSELLGTGAPRPQETDSAAIRLRVKITAPNTLDQLTEGRTLQEIAAIDFPL
jgi:hypothetical protein